MNAPIKTHSRLVAVFLLSGIDPALNILEKAMKTKTVSFLFVVLFCSALSAVIHGNMIGGEPVESWADGGQDFFVMFNSNIDNKLDLFGEDPDNPQGDTCVDESLFTLTDFHIPDDAIIEKAYLIWMGAVDPSKFDEPTDNSVKLKWRQSSLR